MTDEAVQAEIVGVLQGMYGEAVSNCTGIFFYR